MSKFVKLLHIIKNADGFQDSANKIQILVDAADKRELIHLVENVGIIPESLGASSSQEKCFAKASDIVAARAFQELNMQAKAITERGNAADIVAKSIHRSYSLVSDAKAFRLSRTAKNQKDFKVDALSKWRGSNNYAILIAPYFQYPNKESQIYEQSLNENVLLFSWEHLAILLKLDLEENDSLTLEQLWNFPIKHKKTIKASETRKNFFLAFNKYFAKELKISWSKLSELLEEEIENIESRAKEEKQYWKNKEMIIKSYSKEKAIEELVKELKISQKSKAIERYIRGLHNVKEKYLTER